MPQAQHLEIESSRRTAHQILERVNENARSELERSPRALAVSGLAGGLTMGLTALAVAAARAILGPGAEREFIAQLFYPIGFIAVIIGRAQLFTENTLYPVTLVLSERRHVRATLRLWGIVFAANVAGAACFALLAVRTRSLSPEVVRQLVELGVQAANRAPAQIFWSAVLGGWLIALVAWMVSASHWTIGQIAVVWLLTFVVGVARLSHCIAGTGEVLGAVFGGSLPLASYAQWLGVATAGNILGGVVIVSLLNWGQVHAGGDGE